MRSALNAIDAHSALRRGSTTVKGSQQLTTREQQVADLAAAGHTVKQIAALLGISPRTVEVYKSRMVQKLRVQDGDAGSSSGSKSDAD